jgi:hypothetical protein
MIEQNPVPAVKRSASHVVPDLGLPVIAMVVEML